MKQDAHHMTACVPPRWPPPGGGGVGSESEKDEIAATDPAQRWACGSRAIPAVV